MIQTPLYAHFNASADLRTHQNSNTCPRLTPTLSTGALTFPHCPKLFLIDLFIFRQRGKVGGKKRETSMCGRTRAPPGGELSHNPRHVPPLGMEPVTLWFAGQQSIRLATPARAVPSFNKLTLTSTWTRVLKLFLHESRTWRSPEMWANIGALYKSQYFAPADVAQWIECGPVN